MWLLSSFKESTSFIWAFGCFVREMESLELLLNFPLWLRGHGKVDVSDSSLPNNGATPIRAGIACPCEENHLQISVT